jgi:hypothetical protein
MIAKLEELSRIAEDLEDYIEALTRLGCPKSVRALELAKADLDKRVYAVGAALSRRKLQAAHTRH